MQKLPYIFFIVFLLSGCKKDKLKGTKSFLIGEWQWDNTWYMTNLCDNNQNNDSIKTIYPIDKGDNYSIEFFSKGIVKFYKNGKKVDRKRIVFLDDSPSEIVGWEWSYAILLNNRYDNKIGEQEVPTIAVEYKKGIIEVGHFPYSEEKCMYCCSYRNYFRRKN